MTSVPDHWLRIAASRRAVPTQVVIWVSWPQACMTPLVDARRRLVPRTWLAKGRPVCSSTGSASMSARSSSTGPGPFSITATTPVPPTPVVTVKPARRASSAMRRGAARLLHRQLGIGVEVAIEGHQLRHVARRSPGAGPGLAAGRGGHGRRPGARRRGFCVASEGPHRLGLSSITSSRDSKWG